MNPRTTPLSPVQKFLEQLHRDCSKLNGGNVATYIPELARANPDWFGISLVTPTGSVYEVGDSAQPFTIQSISKPFVYGMALEDNGRSDVLKKSVLNRPVISSTPSALRPAPGVRAIP